MAELKVGFGQRDITAPIGVPNVLGVTCFVEEIWDPLYATAAVLDDGIERAAIIGTDLWSFIRLLIA
jgi:hypothetical protein